MLTAPLLRDASATASSAAAFATRQERPRRTRVRALRPGSAALAFSAALTGIVIIPALAQSGQPAQDAPLRVVLLQNADFLLPVSIVMDQAMRETMVRESARQLEFFGETLDVLRFPKGTIDAELVAIMRKKYRGKGIDLVLARAQGGLDFARRYRDELWPGVPIVFYNISAEAVKEQPLPADTTGLLIDIDPHGTIQLWSRLHPDAKRLYVVGGTASYDLSWKRRLGPILAPLEGRVTVTWLDDLPILRMLEELAQVPPDSIVLFTSMLRDVTGRTQVPAQVARQVAEASAAPVYGLLDTYIGQGVVGGEIADFAGQGRAAARLALRVLGGERAAGIPIQPSPPTRCVVDARAIERFGIDEGRLPADCDIRYRAPSLWRDYRGFVLGAIAAIALQGALIAGLLIQRRRRHEAERDAQRRGAELAHASRLALVGELTASIAHEVNQPLGAILSNADAAEMLLGREPMNLDEVRHILADIRRDDLRASEVIRRIRGLLAKREAERQPLDLNAVIADVVLLLHIEAAQRDLAIETALAPSLPAVLGDRIELQQVLLNVVINAMDAMSDIEPGARRLVVRTAADADGVEVAVSDRGHGIAPDQLPQLFDSFFTTKRQGMGLGLSITRTIVEAHGGRIRAENNRDGGATFRFTIPSIGSAAGVGSDAAALYDERGRKAVVSAS